MNPKQMVLFEILDSRGVSRRWFARQVGIHETTLCKIAKGKRPIPAWLKPAAARVLQVPESILFFDDDMRESMESKGEGKAS
ncbi:MAG: helix-turn-helix transcriptional regulator [Dehalococcoidia bacterium]|nr:helix-turn-helix transcriptional regulator [Dehalococcoidia bacterium]